MKKNSLYGLTLRLRRGFCISLAWLLMLCTVAALASCKREERQTALTDSAGGFSFSYPESWEAYSAAGGTCISISDAGGLLPYAMVRFSAFDNADGLSAEAYWNAGKKGFGSVYDSYDLQKRECRAFEKEGAASAYEAAVHVRLKGETRLFGQPKKPDEAADYTVRQLVFESGDGKRLCIATYMSTVENDAIYGSVMEDIKDSFKFESRRQGAETVDRNLADFEIKTPEGWTLCESEAYCTLRCGNATIVVSVSNAGGSADGKQYWDSGYKEAVSAGLVWLETVAEGTEKLGGVEAYDVQYRAASVSGRVYVFRQRIAVRRGEAYTVTLTASEEDYEKACKGFEQIAEGFGFR